MHQSDAGSTYGNVNVNIILTSINKEQHRIFLVNASNNCSIES